MAIRDAFAKALKQARTAKGLTQEDFSNVSSRTYISSLERGLKSPTIDKIEDIAKALNLHPLSLIAFAYLIELNDVPASELFERIQKEIHELKKKN